MFLNAITDFFMTNEKIINTFMIIGLFIALTVLIIISIRKEKKLKASSKIKKMTAIAIFSAISVALYYFKFNLPMIFPNFLEIQLSNVPVFLSGFVFGPISGVLVVVVRTIIKLPFSSTMGVGELADLIIGVSSVLVASLIYQRYRTKKGGAIALVFGSITWVIVGILSNMLFIVPFFVALYFEGDINTFISILKVIPGITSENYMFRYLLLAVLPFNLMLSTIVSLVTFAVYKRTSILYHHLVLEDE